MSIRGLSFHYRKVEVLRGVDWEIGSGVTVLLGPNGSGKSTLIKCLAGILPVQEGVITFAEGGSCIGYVPQNPSLPALARVRDLLSYAAWLSGVPRGEISRRVDAVVERLDLGELQRRRVRTLSGGERQRVAIGAGVINDPSLLLLDEPTVGLDPSQRMRTRRMIADLDTSVVMSTHLTEDIQAMEAQVAILSEGKIQASGSSRDLLGQQTSEGYGSSFEVFYERIVMGKRQIMISLPRTHVLAPFLLMAVGGFLATADLLRTSFPVWQHLSVALHESLWLPGIALVGLSVLLAVLTHPRGSMLHTPVHPRAGVRDFLVQAGAVTASSLMGYAVGLLPVLIRSARYASWGHTHVTDVIIAVSGIALLVCCGYAVGMLTGRMMVIPLAVIVTFLLLGITVEPLWRPWGLVVPVRGIEADTRFVTSPFTAIFAVLATVLVVVFLSYLVQCRLRGGRGYLTWGLALCVLVATAFVWRPEIYVVDPGLEQRCHETQGVQVCLHAAHLPAQADVDEVVTGLQQAGLGRSLREVNDRAVVDRDAPRAGEVFVDIFTGPFSENTVPASMQEGVAYSAANSLITHGCVWLQEDAPMRNRDAVANLRNNVLYLAGYGAVLDDSWNSGVRLSAQEVESIMARHAEDIYNCRWDGTP